jgi:mRNA deadenylase 3'-5' endonuclease subunit Ccr4
MKKLMCEVLENGADIITLQEVDSFRSNGEYNLERQMAKLGYFGVHKEKPGNGNGLMGFVDGPAIFWDPQKQNRFM